MFVMDSQSIVKTLTSNFKDASLSSSLKPKSQENSNGFISDDTEISIFDAHKYFSESNNDSKDIKAGHDLLSVPRLSSVSPIDGYCRNFWTKSFRSTPTPSSEISCNSQTGLLPNPQHSARNPPKINLPLDCINKRWHSAKKWLFTSKKCCCRGEKSVQVIEPNSNSEHRRPVVLINANNTISVCQERKQSSPETASDDIVEIHHIKATDETDFPPVDAPRQQRITASGRSFIEGAVGFTFPIPTNLSKSDVTPLEDSVFEALRRQNEDEDRDPREDDVASDASSDLFEIDSLSVQTTSCPMYCMRNLSDDGHGEVSIDVNVESATVLFTSALDVGGGAALRPPEVGGGKGKMQGNGLSLMRCGKEKAVSMKSVAEGPPMLPLQAGGRPPLPPSFGRCQAAGRLSVAFAACECGVSQASWC